jgi:hypothetical protein
MPPYEPRGAELTQESSGPVRTNNGTVALRNDEYTFHLSFGCVIYEHTLSLFYFTNSPCTHSFTVLKSYLRLS